MSLTVEDVKKIAKLSRIRLKEEEIPRFQTEISSILQWVEQLQEVNTDNVPVLASVAHVSLPQRKDEVTDGNIQADVLKNAPHAEYGCFLVPKVVE
jgi:aspartyl-tRNA(Asn)/glutamyl-tRNA(Gln) amidotransferase subunit C